MKSIFIFVICLFSIFYTQKTFSQNLFFTHFGVDKGLSQSVGNCVYQDSKGYIWFGTQNGLNRFDGYRFENFYHNFTDSFSLSDSWIYSITEDGTGNIWVGTKDGLNKLNVKTGKFSRFNYKKNYFRDVFNNNVYGLAVGSNWTILINTPPFLNLYNTQNDELKTYQNAEIEYDASVFDQNIPIIEDSEGLIWCGTTKGLACFNPRTEKFTNYFTNPKDTNSLSSNVITALFEDKDRFIWVGTQNGLNRFNKINKQFTRFSQQKIRLSDNFIRCIQQDFEGNIWVGTEYGGLNKCYLKQNKIVFVETYNTQSGLLSDDVLSLFFDKSKNLWAGTLNGIAKADLKRPKFNLYRKNNGIYSVNFLDNIIAGVYKDESGKVWVGNWGKGLNIFDRKTQKVEHFSTQGKGNYYISNDFVHVIFEDNKKQIWLGTRNGISIYNKEKNSFVPYSEFFNNSDLPNFNNLRITSIKQDKENKYWVGTQNGVYIFDLNNSFSKHFVAATSEPRISSNLIYNIICDKDGDIWIATSNGLDWYNVKNQSFTHFQRETGNVNSLSNNFVVALCEDFEGKIWIGTNDGVNVFDKKTRKFSLYSKENGLPSNITYEILEDNRKNLWFATGNGLSRFYRETKTFRTYSVEEGLQSVEFNLQSRYKSADGEIFFGGMNGLNSFYPDSLRDNDYIPPVVISGIVKNDFNKKIKIRIGENDELILNSDYYEFVIELAALDFTKPEKNKYSYKIEGLMDEYLEIGTRNFVIVPNLSPGRYFFKVKGSNNDGIWNEIGCSLKIRIRPPWYRTNVAYVMYFLIVGSAIFLFIKIRERNLIQIQNILERKVAERTAEVIRQKQKIEKAHKEITDSINYASRIQAAMLPQSEIFEQCFSDYFILFQPRDVVSGDFYWVSQIHQHLLFSVADCTGHGVPGAFVSALGISLLNEITRREDIQNSYQVLEELRIQIKKTLKQTNEKLDSRDGMDIAFCALNLETNILDFAGAYNSAFLIRDKQLIELKATSNPIGIYAKEKSFESQYVEIQKNDVIYLFSDGYIDQFNETNREKFKTRRFKQLLLEISHLPLEEQKEILWQTHQNWKGYSRQIDDILVLGIRF